MTAELWVLNNGYVGDRVASTVALLRDGDTLAVVDPGMVADRQQILAPMRELGVDDQWVSRDAEGFALTDAIRLIRTPGHTAEDITTLVDTADGLVALTHVWWHSGGPAHDPKATDSAALTASRARVLALRPSLIVPGHGAAFVPDENTPR
ncbi:MBL fold metallo-hydrolase [Catellatospora sp. KI3]|uniref:MBL fold metallo-hydrolase n=1 Tax=Catellatospora sp. KI3 TaxID=3041620 RepID=UPI002482DD80|nr:MBL fold metallo-hydrolase [Catellatospora sp. KI3]MDI1466026.1 MBL fold metallo-hydrolase [Catellatospora sp. KI3]